MSMIDKREYKINIDPRILELLGPSLYTNIYYILAELIANAYDANASNVYIIRGNDKIVVEDDGTGMSYKEGDIRKYLNVAVETRTVNEDTFVKGTTRRKMGRKGVGKLAALSVSERVFIMTRKNNESSGFVLSRHVNHDHKLEALPSEQIKFERISGNSNGTSIVMTHPQYNLSKNPSIIKKNLLKIFPLVGSDFKIHIITEQDEISIDSFDKEMIEQLGALIILGNEYYGLSSYFSCDLEKKDEVENKLLKKEEPKLISLIMKNKYGEEKNYDLQIKGWIGAYKSTRGRKNDQSDFPDNFISLLANGKLGEFNLIQTVGKNKLPEVYVVGQLHVDLFEETELPDMALSNRQGYKTDDVRYEKVIAYVRNELLPGIVEMRNKFGRYRKDEQEKGKQARYKRDEEELKKKVDEYKTATAKSATKKIAEKIHVENSGNVEEIIEGEMNEALSIIGIKRRVDSQKKKILISHASEDKALADLVYRMLSFNKVSDEDIIYTSSDNADCRIPEGKNMLDYLRDFFVDSYSDEKIFIVYVTSKTMISKWHPVLEVGAMWITQSAHKIFNIQGVHRLEAPLDISKEWHTSIIDAQNNISMNAKEYDKFVVKIIDICNFLGYAPKSQDANKKELKKYIDLINS